MVGRLYQESYQAPSGAFAKITITHGIPIGTRVSDFLKKNGYVFCDLITGQRSMWTYIGIRILKPLPYWKKIVNVLGFKLKQERIENIAMLLFREETEWLLETDYDHIHFTKILAEQITDWFGVNCLISVESRSLSSHTCCPVRGWFSQGSL